MVMQFLRASAESLACHFGIATDSLRYRLAKGTFWIFIGSVSGQLSNMLTAIACARLLGEEQFGELGILRNTVFLASVLSGSGLSLLATQYVAAYGRSNPQKASDQLNSLRNLVRIGCLLSVIVMLGGANKIANYLFGDDQLAPPLRVIGLSTVFVTLTFVLSGIILGTKSYKIYGIVHSLAAAIRLVIVFIPTFFFGLIGAAWGFLIAEAAIWFAKVVASRYSLARYMPGVSGRTFSFDVRLFLKDMLPIYIHGASYYPFDWVTRLIMVNQPDGYYKMGLFTAAFSVAALIRFIPDQSVSVITPYLSQYYGEKDQRRFLKLAWVSILIAGALASTGAIAVYLLSGLLLRAFGKGFLLAESSLSILLAANVLFSISSPLYRIYVALERTWIELTATLSTGIALVAAAYFWSPMSPSDLSWAYLVSWFVQAVLMLVGLYMIRLHHTSEESKCETT